MVKIGPPLICVCISLNVKNDSEWRVYYNFITIKRYVESTYFILPAYIILDILIKVIYFTMIQKIEFFFY